MEILNNKKVAVFQSPVTAYPLIRPYHPSLDYPEIKYSARSSEENSVFDSVRSTLSLLDFDKGNFGNDRWNPFGHFISPEDTVLIKPNLVSHFNWGHSKGLNDIDSLITHGSVIRAVVDYAIIALQGRGRIIVGDGPVQLSDWGKLMKLIGFPEMKAFFESLYHDIQIEAIDFRLAVAIRQGDGSIGHKKSTNGIENYYEIDLKSESLLSPITNTNTCFGVVDYPRLRLNQTHNLSHHRYLFTRYSLEADTVINLPKLKTHSKAGFTGSLKNIVGLMGHKDYLPHFRFGDSTFNGDEYPNLGVLFRIVNMISHKMWDCHDGIEKRVWTLLLRFFKLIYLILSGQKSEVFQLTGGGWYGNDTLWRTILDINRIFFHHGSDLSVEGKSLRNRKYFSLIDGIVGGEKLSPLLPSPVRSGLIIAGINPVAVDAVAASAMGLDYRKVPQILNAFSLSSLPLTNFAPDDIEVLSNRHFRNISDIIEAYDLLKFEPSIGYKGHIEI